MTIEYFIFQTTKKLEERGVHEKSKYEFKAVLTDYKNYLENRTQLNSYKCNTVYREIINYTNTEPGNAQKGGSSVTASEYYTCAKKRHLFSVDKHTCSES